MDLGLTHQRQCCEFRNRGPAVAIPELVGSLPAGLSLQKQIPSHSAAPLDGETQALASMLSMQQCPESCQPLGAGEQRGLKGLKKEPVVAPGIRVRL